jgi:predicted XRE-type DNA-binding protein
VKGDGPAAAHLRLRAELMDAVRGVIERRGLRQREAAALFGVAQPRVSDLVRGKLTLFSIDTLVGMLAAAGVTVELRLRSPNDPGGETSRAAVRRVRGHGSRRRTRATQDDSSA